MNITRQTFVVQLHEDDGAAVVENVRTGEHVRVTGLGEIGVQIGRWLAAPPGVDRRQHETTPDRS